jgi:hypothetical protein
MLVELVSARLVGKVGFDDDISVAIARMAKMGEIASLAIEPFAHRGEGIGQISLFDRYLHGHAEHSVAIWREYSHLSAIGARTHQPMMQITIDCPKPAR